MVSELPMGDQDSVSSLPPPSSLAAINTDVEISIPATLKFLISHIKNLIPHPLTSENYAIWRIQVLQQFTATGYAGHLSGAAAPPADIASSAHANWRLADSLLLSALFSTISPALLPYVITATSACEVWSTLERRLQPSSRSRVMQLKNELHHVQMKNSTMQQYLSQIKNIVDNIAASGSKVDPEDVILYTLNGLPPAYNSFKTSIRTSPIPSDLDNLYSLLCNEEIHINQDLAKDQVVTSTAFYAAPNYPPHGRNYKRPVKNKPGTYIPPTTNTNNTSSLPNGASRPTCQICGKTGHTALNCWHRCDLKYAPTTNYNPKALLAQPTSYPT
ncbi:hypothetical protein KFK09_027829 [Dendrobium nobile]|uniref:CCHC-type domain-containing protein n=1 Tax=Dendrobium nobile TaxID=94219 RepID=A0A8T3A126_DENNO|nr:hypothetical protein KFK09_027829 [Dendrobium nobile]